MRNFIFAAIVAATVTSNPAQANEPVALVAPTTPSPNAVRRVPSRTQIIARLIQAIKALEGRSSYLNARKRLKIATAAYDVSIRLKVDPYLMIALARMESDFKGTPSYSVRCYTYGAVRCQADCGITQHYIIGNRRWVFRYCKKLKRNPKLAFTKSFKEILKHIQYCYKKRNQSWHRPFWRCVLNRYNQGTFYYRNRKCHRIKREHWMTRREWRKLRGRCFHRASYWRQVLCFYYGAKTGKKMKRSCRRCYRLTSITRRFYSQPRGTPYLRPSYTIPRIKRSLQARR